MSSEKKGILQRSHWLKLSLELVAVFVGITAGFFFENFREERSNRIQEQKFLTSILENVKADSVVIHEHLDNFKNNLEISNSTVENLAAGPIGMDSAVAMMAIMGTYDGLILQNATYESIINSGNFEIIRDFVVRENILKYYQSVKSLQYVKGIYDQYIDNFIFPFIFENLDFINGNVKRDFDPDSREFRNISAVYYTMVDARVSLANELDSLNLILIESLNGYLR
jgi:hypothetical protein